MNGSIAIHRSGMVLALAMAAGLAASSASALPVVDAQGDFLPGYVGPKDADLDVRFADVVVDPSAGTIKFSGIVAGEIDRTSNKVYVFGIDRGRGNVGRDLIFQGQLGGLPKIGSGVRWDAAAVLTATGQALYFDALNPGVVAVAGAQVSVAGREITATLPLSLFPSQGFKLKDYTFNLWPRSELNLANTVVPDFAPDNDDAPVSIVGDHEKFSMVRSARAEGANCLANATAEVTIESIDSVEVMDVSVRGLPPQTGFDFFVIQVPNAPFGLAWYQGEIQTDKQGRAHQKFMGRFNGETFSVAPGSVPAPGIHHDAFADASVNPATGPVHQFHLGMWFNAPADAIKAGCPGDVTPFNGDHHAGIQALSTRNFADLLGPLQNVRP